MPSHVEIEDIESLRWREGIDDPALAAEIDGLQINDCVRLTLMVRTKPFPGEVVLVRITGIKDCEFVGLLVGQSARLSRLKLHVGSRVVFRKAHIHSVVKQKQKAENACRRHFLKLDGKEGLDGKSTP